MDMDVDVDAIWMQLAAVQGTDTTLLLYLVLCSALVLHKQYCLLPIIA